jgi:hypothetical protein
MPEIDSSHLQVKDAPILIQPEETPQEKYWREECEKAMDRLEKAQKAAIDILFSSDSYTVSHAKRELELAGLFDEDSDYGGMIGEAVMELVRVFASQGHSGFSAPWVLELFNKVAHHKCITPNDHSEYADIGDFYGSGPGIHLQDKRDCAWFSDDGGKTWYNVNDRVSGPLETD